MLSRIKTLVKDHWKKVVVGGVVVQGVIVGVKYATNRFLEYHESQTNLLLQNVRREKHFESIQPTFKSSFVALSATIRDTILECLDTEGLAEDLKRFRGDLKTKLSIWENLKIMGFTRILVIIYGTSLLNILLRIQLSIIGGYLFVESQSSELVHEWRNVDGVILSNNTAMDKELQQKYLSLASNLVKEGIRSLCGKIYVQTAAVVKTIGLKERLSVGDIEQIFLNIAAGIHSDILPTSANSRVAAELSTSPVKYPWKYVFPSHVLEARDNFQKMPKCRPHYEPPDIYERLLSETFDLLDSDDVVGLMSTFEQQGIRNFCDRLGDLVESNGQGGMEDSLCTLPDLESGRVPMAKIIPNLNRIIAHGVQSESDPWLNVLCASELSCKLATNVYESFSNTSVEY